MKKYSENTFNTTIHGNYIWISADGSDVNNGSQVAPIQTFGKAIDLLKEVKNDTKKNKNT